MLKFIMPMPTHLGSIGVTVISEPFAHRKNYYTSSFEIFFAKNIGIVDK